MPVDKIFEYIVETKKNQVYELACEAALYLLSMNLPFIDVRRVLPILTSIYRGMGDPDSAILYAERYLHKSSDYCSVALLTSLAAAYSDKKEYVKAKNICNRAYAIQGGEQGYANELSLVYRRIKKELGE